MNQQENAFRRNREFIAKYGLLFALAGEVALFSALSPKGFSTLSNAAIILNQLAVPLLAASGLTIVLVMGDIDVSFAAMGGLGAAIAVVLMDSYHMDWPIYISILIGSLSGLLIGFINGMLVCIFRISSFIITIGMMSVILGLQIFVAPARRIWEGVPKSFGDSLGLGGIGGISYRFLIALGVALLFWLILEQTSPGRKMCAIGGNRAAALISGIRVFRYRVIGFCICSLCGSLAGILLASKSGAYYYETGMSMLMPAMIASVLGAAVLRPGQFHIPGTAIGVLIFGIMGNGFAILGVPAWTLWLVQGAALIVATTLVIASGRHKFELLPGL